MSTTPISPRISELLLFADLHQRHAEALARATGEHFNIFHTLTVGHLEVITHSPILRELLNPRGRHGQGPAFLRIFLAQLDIKGFDADSPTAVADMEQRLQGNAHAGGRIDILVSDGRGGRIFIENKIYARDQDNQMERYRDAGPNAHLFYLTLDGRRPSNRTEGELKQIDCKCISYSVDILAWLHKCRREAACLPRIRETLSQYIHLIEELTNQSTQTPMNNEIMTEILKSDESLAAFFTLTSQQDAVRAALIARFDAQMEEIAKASGMKLEPRQKQLSERHAFRCFSTPGLAQRNLQIAFGFDGRDCREFFFAFARTDIETPSPSEAPLGAEFGKLFSREVETKFCPVSAYWDPPYRNWGREVLEAIRSGQFVADFQERLIVLRDIARRVCPDEPQKEPKSAA